MVLSEYGDVVVTPMRESRQLLFVLCCVLFGLVWFGLVWFGLVWFGLVVVVDRPTA